jgi:hypothetical protein
MSLWSVVLWLWALALLYAFGLALWLAWRRVWIKPPFHRWPLSNEGRSIYGDQYPEGAYIVKLGKPTKVYWKDERVVDEGTTSRGPG